MAKNYGKLVEGELKMYSYKDPVVVDGSQYYFSNEDTADRDTILKKAGFKEVEFEPLGAYPEAVYTLPTRTEYKETKDKITSYQIPVMDVQRLIKYYTDVAQEVLDEFARQKNYDGIVSLCSYSASTNPQFKAEAEKGAEYRDQVWAAGYAMLDQLAGSATPDLNSLPTRDQFIEMLPSMTW